jgi:hypothetical protein
LLQGYQGLQERAGKVPAGATKVVTAAGERLIRLDRDKSGQAKYWEANMAEPQPGIWNTNPR